MILVVFVKSNLIVTYIVSFAAGVGVASAFLLPWWDSLPRLNVFIFFKYDSHNPYDFRLYF